MRIDIIEGAPADHIVTGSPSLTDCDAAQFWTERVYVALPSGHVLARQETIRWSQLRTETFIISERDPGPEIHDFLIKHLADLGVHPTIERHRVGRDNLMQIVSFRRGITLTSESTIAIPFPGIVYRQLEGETLPFCAVWSPRNDNPAWRRMLSSARIIARKGGICANRSLADAPNGFDDDKERLQ
ncbi:LysR family substrate-binding domain-containing protein [Notoacmeibacter marinus]|uniref:LysR family substrate-binding domain-containing protein n=1 Tax=Notoacmeibacter marinus TaxID=1876515 RepID=UPI001FE01F89|nr:LysR family substrate-binding domain-containing protein [Notoacmeibacter marinus]